MKVILSTLNAKYIHSSLALRCLKAYAEADFPNIQLREYTIKDLPMHIAAELYPLAPDVIAFSMYIWNVEETIPILQLLRQVLPNVTLVLGGPEVSYDTRHWLKRLPEVDFIVQGEGEATFHHLLTELHGAKNFEQVQGLAYRRDGNVVINPARPKLHLDSIPSPYGSDSELLSLRDRIVYFETSRGCPFSCQFCLSSIESGVRYFSLERTKLELKRLIDAGIRTIKFVDRTFNLNRQYALSLFEFLIDNHKQTVFQFEITGDIQPKEIVEYLNQHAPKGLFRFELGVQSTNDLTNSLVKRRQNFKKLSDTILALKHGGKVVQHLDLIAGLPEEDYASFKKTFNDVFAFQPDELQLGFLKMLRGTGLRLGAADYGYAFMQRAPYEMLGNRVLTFADMIRIKQVEDVLEKYWNDNKLKNTVRYLTRYAFSTPFDFFQDFGTYWEQRGWSRMGHQFTDLFRRLQEFLASRSSPETSAAAQSYMMLDFLTAHRIRPHAVWWERTLVKQERNPVVHTLSTHAELLGERFTNLNLTEDDIHKHVFLERTPYTLDLAHLGSPLAPEPGLIAVYYPPGLDKGQSPEVFTMPFSKLLERPA